jgi:hypothetical protein
MTEIATAAVITIDQPSGVFGDSWNASQISPDDVYTAVMASPVAPNTTNVRIAHQARARAAGELRT